MQWRNPDQAKKDEAPEQGRAEIIDSESAQVNHESKNPGKSAALVVTEPRGVDFHHPRRAERLHVAVDSPNQHKEPKQAPKGGDTESDVHDDGARCAD